MTEEWYDDVIAPKLAEVAALCQAQGCALVAVVEYAPEKRGSTLLTPPGSGTAMVLLRHLDKCGDNIDGFLLGILRSDIDVSRSVFLSRWKSEGHTVGDGQ